MKSMSTTCLDATGSQRGFAIVSAVFLMVVLAVLGAFMLNFSASQNAASTADVQGSRAYQAARAGLEWGIYQVLDLDPVNQNFPGVAVLPPCPAAAFPVAGFAGTALAGFATVVQCVTTDATEGNKIIRVYSITSTATLGAPNTTGYVQRQLTAKVEKCKDPDAPAPAYACT